MNQSSRYQLQTLFDLRLNVKTNAEEEFLMAQLRLQKEVQTLSTMEIKLKDDILFRQEKENEYLRIAAQGTSKIHDLQIQGIHIDVLKKREKEHAQAIELQKQKVENLRTLSKEKSKDMLIKRADFEVVSKLKESWMKKIAKENEKKEEDNYEEIATFKHASKEK